MALSDSVRIQLDILKKFPLLVPTSSNFRNYEGFIQVKHTLFLLSLEVPCYPSSKNVTLNCEWKLTEVLRDQEKTVNEWIRGGIPLNEFLDQLHALICSCLENGGGSRLCLERNIIKIEEQLDNTNLYSAILSELKELGTQNLVSISSDFKNLSLSSRDSNGDLHLLNLKLMLNHDSGRKQSFEVVDTDLPEAIVKIIQQDGQIGKAFKTFCEQIEILQSIWDSLALIDERCWVIDPIHPRKADVYRRIYITPPSVMAQLSWDPLKPKEPPEIKFQGGDAESDAIRCTYEEHLENWDQKFNVIDNLCSVLQLSDLPQPPPPSAMDVSQTVETGECSICYQVQVDEKLPEESCGKCLSNFHTSCLFEWLDMTPGSRQVHGHISGPCPNCETAMKCPCPNDEL